MSSDAKKIRRWPIYIFLFPVFFVFHGYTENFHFVSPLSALLLCLKYAVAAAVIVLIFYLLYKKFSKAALMTFFLLAFDFLFGYIMDILKELFPSGFITKYSFIIPAFIVIAIVLFIMIKKQKTLSQVTFYLNVLLILLLCIDAVTLLINLSGKNQISYRNIDQDFMPCTDCSKPDVYIIMLDEYAGSAELRDIFHYDNSPFLDSLADRGFKTITNSNSNYNYTPYSTASTLNMEYLDPQKIQNVKKGFKYAINKIDKNKVVGFFLSNGYHFFNCSPFTVGGQSAKVEGSFVPANTKLITAGTFLARFEKEVMLNAANKLNLTWYLKRAMYATLNNNSELYTLTKKIAEDKSTPKIIYTHLLMPHYPYYYTESGELHPFDTLRHSQFEDTAHYLAYLKYTNKQMILLIDHILSNSSNQSIIVLLSDHGYRHYKNNNEMKYYFTNLLSIHLPHRNYSLFNDSINNVNFFRILLNSEFNQKLSLEENNTYLIDF